jgi:release factor glutamine methyltransferase
MKKFAEAYNVLVDRLSQIYDLLESKNIAKYYLDDTYGVKYILSQKTMSGTEEDKFLVDLEKLVNKVPLAYVTCKSFFYGLEFYVNEAVLIPRPETEELVDWLVKDMKLSGSQKKIIDIGTGSGCIACTIKKMLPSAQLTAVDVSEEALAVCIENAKRLDLELTAKQVDVLSVDNKIFLSEYDVIVSNPPYITVEEKKLMDSNVLDHEPHLALFTDSDALVFYRKIAELINPANHIVYLELNQYYAEEIRMIFHEQGMKTELREDMQGNMRMLKAF